MLGWLTSITDPEENVTFYQYDDMGRQTKEVKVTGSGITGKYSDGSTLLQQTHDVDLDLEDFGGSLPDGFSAIWTGAIYIDDPGNVTFFLDNTDYSDLYIDDTYVSSHNSGSGRTKSDGDQVSLTGGWHTITVDFIDYNDEPENDLILKYDTGTGEVVIPPDALFTTQVTTIDYDAVGRVESIIDPNGNETDYLYDNADRLTSETITVDFVPLTRSYIYDDNGNLTQLTDRDERVTTYEYDQLNRLTAEKWYTDQYALDYYPNSPLDTISYEYDEVGNLTAVSDSYATYDYDYDNLNRQMDVSQSITGLTPTIGFDYGYDDASRMTSSSATIGSTDDFANTYDYDRLGNLTMLVQTSQTGGNAVSDKRVDLSYDDTSQMAGTLFWASIFQSNIVAGSQYTYDQAGRLIYIDHTGLAAGSTYAEEYGYAYDNANRLTGFTSLIDGIDATYDYDATGQLTTVDHTDSMVDEAYAYDANGNRTDDIANAAGTFDYTTGDFNRLLSDGTYTYEYDDEGNLVYRYVTNDPGDRTYYTWDHRNRLVHVSEWSGDHEVTIVDYSYDAFNELVAISTEKPFEEGRTRTVFVYDGGQAVLQFDDASEDPTPIDLGADDLSHRYLWNPQAVDQLFADEQVDWSDEEADGEVLWALTDHLGSVGDVVDSNGDLRLHRQFDSFGNVVGETHYNTSGTSVFRGQTGYIDEAFAFTGRWFDKATGLQNNLNRWYDPQIGRWLSEDPIGFAGGDANLYRYVGNQPTGYIDPSGLDPVPGGRGYGGPGSGGFGGGQSGGHGAGGSWGSEPVYDPPSPAAVFWGFWWIPGLCHNSPRISPPGSGSGLVAPGSQPLVPIAVIDPGTGNTPGGVPMPPGYTPAPDVFPPGYNPFYDRTHVLSEYPYNPAPLEPCPPSSPPLYHAFDDPENIFSELIPFDLF